MRKVIQDIYGAIEGIESFATTLIVQKITNDNMAGFMVDLPSETGIENLHKDGFPPFIMTFSKERLIRIHLNENKCTVQQRYEIYHEFRNYLQSIYEGIDIQRAKKKNFFQNIADKIRGRSPEEEMNGGLNWWKAVDQISVQNGIERIGSIPID